MPPQPVVSMIDRLRTHPPDTISQAELDYAISIRNRVESLLKTLSDYEEGLFVRRKAGARVEPGPHVAEIIRQSRGSRYSERIVIK